MRTCLNVGRGLADAFAVAGYETLGLHPDDIWPRMVERKRWLMGKYFREGVDDVTFHPHPELVAAYELRISAEIAAQTLRKKPCRRVEILPRRTA